MQKSIREINVYVMLSNKYFRNADHIPKALLVEIEIIRHKVNLCGFFHKLPHILCFSERKIIYFDDFSCFSSAICIFSLLFFSILSINRKFELYEKP